MQITVFSQPIRGSERLRRHVQDPRVPLEQDRQVGQLLPGGAEVHPGPRVLLDGLA